MAARKPGLGRGLEALLPGEAAAAPQPAPTAPLRLIDHNPTQPRRTFDDDALRTLADSIKEIGVLQPIVVRPAEDGRYRLVAGERRLRAAQMAGLEEIPIVVREGDQTADLVEALVENLNREDLSPLEEAAAFRQLVDDFGLTHEEAGRRLGRSRSAISNTLRLLQLAPRLQALVDSGALTAGHARALLAIEDPAVATEIGERAAAEGWSVRQVEQAARRATEDQAERKGPTPSARPAPIIELEERLAEQLGTRVRIDMSRRGGRVTIRFGSIDDLERIYGVLFGS